MATTFDDVEQLLVSESGRIGPDIYRKTVDTSPWLKLVQQDAWPDEMGHSVSVMVYERSLPYTTSALKTAWNPIVANTINVGGNNADQNAIAPLGGVVEFGQTLRTYGLAHTALESPNLSLNDLRFPLKRKEQLSNIMQILTESTAEIWIQRYRDQYTEVAENKILAIPSGAVAANSGTIDYSVGAARQVNGHFPLPNSETYATSNVTVLSQLTLDKVYMDLLRNGAGANAYDRQNGAPVFLAIMSPETSDMLIKSEAAIRQDFRWSDRVSELLAPLGVQRTYRNYHHLVDAFNPRWNYTTAGGWARVYPFVRVANTGTGRQGYKYDLNAAYTAAEYEDTIIFVPEVFTSLVPKPLSIGNGMEFSPQNYRGEFTWKNILDRATNPDGTLGYFRAIFSNGAKPVFPHQGYVIRHKRNVLAIGYNS
jgi:hypothetical protein